MQIKVRKITAHLLTCNELFECNTIRFSWKTVSSGITTTTSLTKIDNTFSSSIPVIVVL